MIEPLSDAADEALLQYSQVEKNNSEAMEQIENEEVQNICLNQTFDQSTKNNITIDVSIPQTYSLVRMIKLMPTFNLSMFRRDKFWTLFIHGPKKL